MSESLESPFPYFGGKSLAAPTVWRLFGDTVNNYVEPFAGSIAMLLQSPRTIATEVVNDYDGFIANFWRAISHDAAGVVKYVDYPCSEVDLTSRHYWLVNYAAELTAKLQADPDFYDVKAAGWWCWGLCNWIGSGFCSGNGPWIVGDEGVFVKKDKDVVTEKRGINRQLPHVAAGLGVNRKVPATRNQSGNARTKFLMTWFLDLQKRLRDVRICCGDWSRVLQPSVLNGANRVSAVFLDPPYSKGNMDYAVGGVGTDIPHQVRDWCRDNGKQKNLRIVLCGHKGEHDELLEHGWFIQTWQARKGYAVTEEALQNRKDETLWCSPNCVPLKKRNSLF